MATMGFLHKKTSVHNVEGKETGQGTTTATTDKNKPSAPKHKHDRRFHIKKTMMNAFRSMGSAIEQGGGYTIPTGFGGAMYYSQYPSHY